MIQFRAPQLSDREKLDPIFRASGNEGCELTFTNFYLWGRQEFALVEGCVVLFSHWDGQSTYVYPIGNGDHKAAISRMLEDAQKRGLPFRLSGISERSAVELENNFPGQFYIQPRRNVFDYVYAIDQLADLPGKKLQQKRNHINRFIDANPNWTVQPLEPALLDECREMVACWYALRSQEQPDMDYMLEKRAIRRAFEAFSELQMEGLVLRSEGKIVAMTMGNLINDTIFDVNFEKAFANIQGAYPMVCREFARYLRQRHPDLQYLNREDDMGLPGLRKSKESYRPDHMVRKFRAFLIEEVM